MHSSIQSKYFRVGINKNDKKKIYFVLFMLKFKTRIEQISSIKGKPFNFSFTLNFTKYIFWKPVQTTLYFK